MHACAIANSALLLMEKRMHSCQCTDLINRFNCRPRPHHPLLSVGAAAASKTSVSTARLSQAVYSMSACVALCPRSRSTQPLLPDTGTTSDFIAAALQLARAMRAPAFGSLNPSSAGTSSAVDAAARPIADQSIVRSALVRLTIAGFHEPMAMSAPTPCCTQLVARISCPAHSAQCHTQQQTERPDHSKHAVVSQPRDTQRRITTRLL